MTDHETHDPGEYPEDGGIPDLQDNLPEAEWSDDPERESVPGDTPVAVDRYGTTGAERAEGEPLGLRLAEEEPDVGDEEAEQLSDEPAGQLSDDPLPWRSANQDTFSHASPAHGLTAEETAVHVAEDDDPELGLDLEDVAEAAEAPDPRPERLTGPAMVDLDTDEDQ